MILVDWFKAQFPESKEHRDPSVDDLVAETKAAVTELRESQEALNKELVRHQDAALALLEARRKVLGS